MWNKEGIKEKNIIDCKSKSLQSFSLKNKKQQQYLTEREKKARQDSEICWFYLLFAFKTKS